ncbi:MAG: 2-hydroxyhepta-2,4-diene,7-dioate isomerase, partial [Aeromicrobium sp.]|nr:2-hydroxyhepta-2,4-diene,7-dioate isomerase [Aeromicrobium sp.]
MRIARFAGDDDPRFGVIGDDNGVPTIAVLNGDPLYAGLNLSGQKIPLADVRLLAPVIPRSKVVCVGKNYAKHAAEMGGEVPEEPLIFLKPNTSVIGPGEPIFYPEQSENVHFEGEL